jgi:2-polyprenyl-3-methyl-5-hydroxy-6-metoxy-1,4-benzoquinol methylase
MYSYNNESRPKLEGYTTYPLPGDCIREMETHTIYTTGQERDHFNNISANYDDIMQIVGYPDPDLIAKATQKIAEVRKIAVPDALVADFGCGTGLVGEAMTKLGFRNIYGIDCSEGMLQIA